ncbi:MAG TPA: hypothetical protein VNY10_14560, partial [Roseiarcus sp.]|nr:hypothetical protein [Roseiarcus sp.]
AFRAVFRQFVLLCRRLDLYGRELLAVDGTRIKAVNNKDRNFTRSSLRITWTSMPRRARKRASQNPSRPASWVRMTRAISRPAAAHLAFRRSTKEANPSRADVRCALSPFEEWDHRPAGARQSIARGDLVAKPCTPLRPASSKCRRSC